MKAGTFEGRLVGEACSKDIPKQLLKLSASFCIICTSPPCCTHSPTELTSILLGQWEGTKKCQLSHFSFTTFVLSFKLRGIKGRNNLSFPILWWEKQSCLLRNNDCNNFWVTWEKKKLQDIVGIPANGKPTYNSRGNVAKNRAFCLGSRNLTQVFWLKYQARVSISGDIGTRVEKIPNVCQLFAKLFQVQPYYSWKV